MPLGGSKHVLCLTTLGFCLPLLLGAGGLETNNSAPRQELHSVFSVLQLTSDAAELHIPVVLRAQVLLTDTSRSWLFVQDRDLGLFVAPSPQGPTLVTGDWVEISGSTADGGFDPIVKATSVRVIEHRPLPAPLLLRDELPSPARISNVWARASGLVLRAHPASAFNDTFNLNIQLASGTLLSVVVAHGQTCDPQRLVLSRVNLMGVYGVRYSRGALYVADCSSIQILQRPIDLWSLPFVPVVGLLTRQTGTSFGDVVHIRGTVTAFRPHRLCIQQGRKGVFIDVAIADSSVALGSRSMSSDA